MVFTSLAYHMDIEWLEEAYRRTKKNGAAGVDGVTAKEYEANLQENLKGLLERAKSGCYKAPPVKRAYIPKGDGKGEQRPIGIPTIYDRIAQMVAKMYVEPVVEPIFHENSYGYRPNKSAINAVGQARERCWRYDFVIELDIKVITSLLLSPVST